ncbi:MAG TPA: amino acid racemase [Spirochaetales bacterium]|nr:aspartate/glutamate racemase family protein [Spirochaetales bacterium]HPE36526.1 amino acid racemase [Spirochaetales bacterium]
MAERGTAPVIGIIGGMGPLATAELFKKLTLAVRAPGDSGHPRVIVDSDPSIPDRTEHILGTGPDPLPALMASARRLTQAGATLCVVASVTAHAYLDGLRAAVHCEFMSAFDALKDHLSAKYPAVKRIGVLATTGAIKAELFERHVPELRVHYSDAEAQERFVMEAIYGPQGIKAGNVGDEPRRLLKQAAARLIARGADLVVVACAEMSLVLGQADVSVPLVDPMQCLVDRLVARIQAA